MPVYLLQYAVELSGDEAAHAFDEAILAEARKNSVMVEEVRVSRGDHVLRFSVPLHSGLNLADLPRSKRD